MTVESLVFYLFATIACLSAIMVVAAKNTVRSVLFLVLTFFATAGLWMLLEAEFLAITLVLVYVGAVMVLFLFVVMMLDIDLSELRQGFIRFLPVGIIAALGSLLLMLKYLGPKHFGADFATLTRHPEGYSNIAELGKVLYTDYLLAFELAAALLLVAIVAAISLSFRGPQNRKLQQPGEQVKVSKADRLEIVKMPATAKKEQS